MKKKLLILAAVVLIVATVVVLIIAAAAAVAVIPKENYEAYSLLLDYANRQALSMELTVDYNGTILTAQVEKQTVDGHTVTTVTKDSMTLYCAEGVVFLPNGSAYKLMEGYPDYAQLLELVTGIYQNVSVEAEDGIYSITAQGENARAIGLLLAGTDKVDSIDLSLVTAENAIQNIDLSLTTDSGSIHAVLEILGEDPTTLIPGTVRKAIETGEFQNAENISADLLILMNAFSQLEGADPLAVSAALEAECGILSLKDTVMLYRWQQGISAVETGHYTLYFTDEAVCDQYGNTVSYETEAIETGHLLDIVWQLCMNGQLERNGDTYSLSLDQQGMAAVAYAIAPETAKMDISFDAGSLEITLTEGSIESVSLRVEGTVTILMLTSDAALGAELTLVDGASVTLPEAVTEALGH